MAELGRTSSNCCTRWSEFIKFRISLWVHCLIESSMRLCWLWAQTLGWKYFGTPVAESQSCAEPMFMPTVRIRDGRHNRCPKLTSLAKWESASGMKAKSCTTFWFLFSHYDFCSEQGGSFESFRMEFNLHMPASFTFGKWHATRLVYAMRLL